MPERALVTPIAIRRLKRLQMNPPPAQLFDDLLGYAGTARYVALYWSRAVLAPVLTDGVLTILARMEPYRIWRFHPRVVTVLAQFNIGDAADSAGHWLLVDRYRRILHVGRVADVSAVLECQGRTGPDELVHAASIRTPDCAVTSGAAGLEMGGKRYKRPLHYQYQLLHDLEAWIDGHLLGG